jgi:hypothetical protein
MYISVELDDYRQSLQFRQIMVERTQLLMLRKQTSQWKEAVISFMAHLICIQVSLTPLYMDR